MNSALFSAHTHSHALDDSLSHDDLVAHFSVVNDLPEEDCNSCDLSSWTDESSAALIDELPSTPSATLLYRRDPARYPWRSRPQREQEEQARTEHDQALIVRARAGDLAAREEMITSLLHHVERFA